MTTADSKIAFATGARLRPWSRVWRYALVVLLSGVAYVSMYGVLMVSIDSGGVSGIVESLPDPVSVFLIAGLDALVCLVAIGLLPLRRQAPTTIAIVTAALGVVSSSTSAGPAMLALVSNATHRRWLPLVANIVVYVSAVLVFDAFFPVVPYDPSTYWFIVVTLIASVLVPAGFGLFIGARRALLASLHQRALEAERERELQLRAAQAGERTRIAREMHDVLAHRISLVALHAGGLAYREDLSREETAAAAVLVQDNARRALAELRQVLGVLRADGTGIEPPQPTLEALPALVDDVRRAGGRIDVVGPELEADPPELVSRTAFRVVQEALTNARKHAPGSVIRVGIDGRPGGLLAVEVTNGAADPHARPLEAAGSGMGLAGLAERVDLAGGTIDYGPDGKHGYAVRAWLPWEGETDE